MSATTLSVKRHNHRIHPCDPQRKTALLLHLLSVHAGLRTLVVIAENAEALRTLVTEANVTVAEDASLPDAAEAPYDLLISYDLPAEAADYLARLSYTKCYALLLLEPEAQQRLYPVERLLGRTMMQETIKGFEPGADSVAAGEKQRAGHAPSGHKSEARRDNNRARSGQRGAGSPKTKRPSDRADAPQTDAPSSADKWNKKKQPPSRYLGKDENGKPRFSGKTRERNHAFDGTPKTEEQRNPKQRSGGKPGAAGGPKRYEKPAADAPAKAGTAKGGKPYGAPKAKGKAYGGAAGKAHPAKGAAKKTVSKRPPRKIPLKSLQPPKEQE